MFNKPPYLSGGRGRGQGIQKRTGYSIGNLVIDRKAENKKAKMDTKPMVATDSKNLMEKRKEQQVYKVDDKRQNDITTEMDDDIPVDDEQHSRQEQILENVIKSYREGSSDSKYFKRSNNILAYHPQSGPGTDARNIVRMFTNEFPDLYHLLGADWQARSSVLFKIVQDICNNDFLLFILTDLEL